MIDEAPWLQTSQPNFSNAWPKLRNVGAPQHHLHEWRHVIRGVNRESPAGWADGTLILGATVGITLRAIMQHVKFMRTPCHHSPQ